ncbi:hypothetical protein [Streptomyces sp. NPDC002463]
MIAHVDPRRLDERPGLFTLIVLGEGIARTMEAASEAEWTNDSPQDRTG